MANVEARIKVKGKQFEISVDLDEALKVRAGKGNVSVALNPSAIYNDVRKGMTASKAELEAAFDTSDVYAIAERIMKKGEIQKDQDFRDAERENRINKVENKKIKITIPARFSAQVYGMLKDYKESEEWLGNGDLQVIMNIPSGLQIDFYDKLNSVTHGAIVSQEMK